MSRSRGIGIGIPFGQPSGVPFRNNLLRFLSPRDGSLVLDLVGYYDADETSLDVYDLNPDEYLDANFELQVGNRDNLTIWSEVDSNGLTIRDLPGYNSLDPYEWDEAEIDVDIINTYINASYTARAFAFFSPTRTDFLVYDKQMTCAESTRIHDKLGTGGWWIFNRGVLNGCGVIKADGIIWSP